MTNEIPEPSPSRDRCLKAREKILRQNRFLTRAYGIVAVLGVLSLIFDRSLMVWLSILIPGLIAFGEHYFGGRFRESPSRKRWHGLLGFEVGLLVVGMGLLVACWEYPIVEQLETASPELRELLSGLTESIGMTPESYLSLIWKLVIGGFALVFGLKMLMVIVRYWYLGRRACASTN